MYVISIRAIGLFAVSNSKSNTVLSWWVNLSLPSCIILFSDTTVKDNCHIKSYFQSRGTQLYDGLNHNVPDRPCYLDSWFTVGATIWVGSEGVVWLMEVYHCRGLWDYVDSSCFLFILSTETLMTVGGSTMRNLAKEAAIWDCFLVQFYFFP